MQASQHADRAALKLALRTGNFIDPKQVQQVLQLNGTGIANEYFECLISALGGIYKYAQGDVDLQGLNKKLRCCVSYSDYLVEMVAARFHQLLNAPMSSYEKLSYQHDLIAALLENCSEAAEELSILSAKLKYWPHSANAAMHEYGSDLGMQVAFSRAITICNRAGEIVYGVEIWSGSAALNNLRNFRAVA